MPSILFAEDKLSYKKNVEDALRNAGFEVTSVENGTDAIEALDAQIFDIVFTDYCMPGAQGDAVARYHQFGNGGTDRTD
jgi:two-component system, cell cycle response regulator CpdR